VTKEKFKSAKRRSQHNSSKNIGKNIGLLLLVVAALMLILIGWNYQHRHNPTKPVSNQGSKIANALVQHPVGTLVGQTQRLLTLKSALDPHQSTVLTSKCPDLSNPSQIDPNRVDYRKSSFAYLLTYPASVDQSASKGSPCTLSQIVAAYGRPNESILVEGTLSQPKEELLVYDKGAHTNVPRSTQIKLVPATVMPKLLSELPVATACIGQTSVNIVAHQDDDLLFLNPDISHDIESGKCIRTIYLTAGDAGLKDFYWLSRERGSQDAYSHMTIENDDLWIKRIVKFTETEFITIATPKNNPKISLIFMHLPDGNFDGSGFVRSDKESLTKLYAHKIGSIHSVDKQSTYSSEQLTTALVSLIKYYQPSLVRSQSTERSFKNDLYLDHSDHITTGLFAQNAYQRVYSNNTIPFYAYIGYPIHGIHENLSLTDSRDKTDTLLSYAKQDNGVCQSLIACAKSPTYGSYLKRQYKLGN
jgi:hypothetical protein